MKAANKQRTNSVLLLVILAEWVVYLTIVGMPLTALIGAGALIGWWVVIVLWSMSEE
jgi:hypothetical protein